MRIFLAGCSSRPPEITLHGKPPFVLESFYYAKPWLMEYVKSPHCKMFLLDSGAFTFMNSRKGPVDFERYLYKYIEFINRHDIRYFFELDIDAVVGLAKVEKYREILERETGKKCIPVWHKNRGKQYFMDMVKTYDYVAIGGIVTKEIKPSEYKYFPWFIEQAHRHGAKIHGLGFTNPKHLRVYKFDTVDSTAWLRGTMSGDIFQFTGNEIKVVIDSQKGKRLRNRRETDMHNIREWVKYAWYMEGKGGWSES